MKMLNEKEQKNAMRRAIRNALANGLCPRLYAEAEGKKAGIPEDMIQGIIDEWEEEEAEYASEMACLGE